MLWALCCWKKAPFVTLAIPRRRPAHDRTCTCTGCGWGLYDVCVEVAGLLGNMQPFSEDSSAVTTSENLANLMFQLQMTGYMFKNADYRLSLRQSLSGQPQAPQGPGKQAPELPRPQASPRLPEVKGTIKLTTAEGTTIEVAADAYMAELRGEVDKLRQDLVKVANARNARSNARSALKQKQGPSLVCLTAGPTWGGLDHGAWT